MLHARNGRRPVPGSTVVSRRGFVVGGLAAAASPLARPGVAAAQADTAPRIHHCVLMQQDGWKVTFQDFGRITGEVEVAENRKLASARQPASTQRVLRAVKPYVVVLSQGGPVPSGLQDVYDAGQGIDDATIVLYAADDTVVGRFDLRSVQVKALTLKDPVRGGPRQVVASITIQADMLKVSQARPPG
jgi:hypothetical protein